LSSSLVRRFENVVNCHGARIAVQDAKDIWTYNELNNRANRIAHVLLSRLTKRKQGVAILLGQSSRFTAAVWGVLKTGGFYIPIDPAYPTTRLMEILGSGAASMIITDREHKEHAEEVLRGLNQPLEIILLDDLPDHGEANPDVLISPDDLCCVIFTSGTTGKPKGACQQHRNLLHSTMWYSIPAGLHASMRMSMLHSVSAIAAATALYGAHLNGAALFPANVRAIGVDRIPAWIDELGIDVLHVVPTLLRRIAQVLPAGKRLPTVRFLRMGGEAVSLSDWQLWLRCFTPGCRLLVCLGSTEALNYRQTVYEWNSEPPSTSMPVGDAMPDKEVRLLNDDGRTVPVGNVGEIVVRSPYLFTGYWQQPELTTRLLKPDPERDGWNLFHTGDLGCMDASGAMRHVGRNDHLVKVMGHRVHPADVEEVIRHMPGVLDAAVTCTQDDQQSVRLTAHVIPERESCVSVAAVRTYVSEHLPEFMVPTRIFLLKEFPVLPNGKLDRLGMSRLVQNREHTFVPPQNPFEETLAEIWKRNLGVAEIGIEDDLFGDCGADSMAAASIMADVRTVFGRDLPLNTLYGKATIASLGEWLRESTGSGKKASELVVHQNGTSTPVFGVCGAFGHALRLLLIGRGLPDQQPLYGLEPPEMDWERAGCRTVEDMAAWYVKQIKQLQATGPYRLIGTSFGGIIVHTIARQLQHAGESVSLLAMVDTSPPDCQLPQSMDRAIRRDWAAGMNSDDPLIKDGIRIARQQRAALDRFILRDAFNGKITYFKCEESFDPHDRDRRMLWQHFATRGLDVISVPGIHGQFHQDPQLTAIVSALQERL